MTLTTKETQVEGAGPAGEAGDRSDWKVVLQFFIVPLALVAVLVTVFFGLQVLRSRHPDPRTTLDDLESKGGFLLPWVGDPKRWQSGYDLSLLLRSGDGVSTAAILPEMMRAFHDARHAGDPKLRRYLALALGRTGDARAGTVLAEGLEDGDGETRLNCAWGLMQIGGAPALGVLRQAVTSHVDAGVRKMAIFALGQLGDREGAPVLRRALGDPDTDARWNAAIALARIGDASGEPVLIEILGRFTPDGAPTGAAAQTRDASPALNAVRALALLRDEPARAALSRAAQSAGSEDVRRTARLALESPDPSAGGASP
ncbi:MAG: hypothetical protein AUI52_02135 [Acidobacteria bacterium 13_1_40CM_2_68_10]|nr:MAG: hypothetical protein AUI52_02135 [Acidobacteria bacterium 13_1_40CM_2_68_10]